MKIPLIKPFITQETKDKVCEVLESCYLTEGPVTRAFEERCGEYLGASHTIAVSNCTVGLEMCLRAIDAGPGDEVIVPDYTYPATADVVETVGAKIVIVDIDRESMLIDYDALEAAITPRTKAVIPVSLFGNPLDYDRLRALCQTPGIRIVEDAACSLGATYKGVKVGCLSDFSVFSCHPRKFITTGEGGLVTTEDTRWADWLTSYKHFGMGCAAGRLEASFEMIGSNHKLSNVLAAIGLVQMSSIDELLARRRLLAGRYYELLADQADIGIPVTTAGGEHSYQSCCVFVKQRDAVMAFMRAKGIEVQIGTYSLHMHPAFRDNANCELRGDMSNSRYAFDHCLALPLYHDLTEDDQALVVAELMNALKSS